MITLRVGKLGVGKSYVATVMVWRTILRGRDAYVNWDIDFTNYARRREKIWKPFLLLYRLFFKSKPWGKVFRFYDLRETYAVRNGELFFDEAHADLNARNWQSIPPEFVKKLTQSRKYGLNMHFISQHAKQVDVVVLRLANEFIINKKFSKIFYYKIYDGEHIEALSSPTVTTKPKNDGFGILIFSKSFAKSYDTFGLFGRQFQMWERPPMWYREKIFEPDLTTTPVRATL